MTRSQRPLLAAALAIAVVTGLGVVAATGADGQDDSRDGSTSRTAAAAARTAPTGSATHAGAARRGPSPSDAPSAGAPAPTPVGEVMAASPAPSGLPGLAKAVARARTPWVGPSLPRAAADRGTLVPGFPEALAPLSSSVVVSSSVSPSSGGTLQVALVARDERGPGAVLTSFRARLAELGAHEVPASSVGGTQTAAFRRGDSSVVVTATAGSPAQYTVFATVHAKS